MKIYSLKRKGVKMAKEAQLPDFPVNEQTEVPPPAAISAPSDKANGNAEQDLRTVNYGFFVVSDDPSNFKAEVRDGARKVIFTVDKNAFGSSGYMKDEYDMEGLRQHLISQKILEPDQYILNATLLGR